MSKRQKKTKTNNTNEIKTSDSNKSNNNNNNNNNNDTNDNDTTNVVDNCWVYNPTSLNTVTEFDWCDEKQGFLSDNLDQANVAIRDEVYISFLLGSLALLNRDSSRPDYLDSIHEIASLLVDNTGKPIAYSLNVCGADSKLAHAEFGMLIRFFHKYPDRVLPENCTLYTTLESCDMCRSALMYVFKTAKWKEVYAFTDHALRWDTSPFSAQFQQWHNSRIPCRNDKTHQIINQIWSTHRGAPDKEKKICSDLFKFFKTNYTLIKDFTALSFDSNQSSFAAIQCNVKLLLNKVLKIRAPPYIGHELLFDTQDATAQESTYLMSLFSLQSQTSTPPTFRKITFKPDFQERLQHYFGTTEQAIKWNEDQQQLLFSEFAKITGGKCVINIPNVKINLNVESTEGIAIGRGILIAGNATNVVISNCSTINATHKQLSHGIFVEQQTFNKATFTFATRDNLPQYATLPIQTQDVFPALSDLITKTKNKATISSEQPIANTNNNNSNNNINNVDAATSSRTDVDDSDNINNINNVNNAIMQVNINPAISAANSKLDDKSEKTASTVTNKNAKKGRRNKAVDLDGATWSDFFGALYDFMNVPTSNNNNTNETFAIAVYTNKNNIYRIVCGPPFTSNFTMYPELDSIIIRLMLNLEPSFSKFHELTIVSSVAPSPLDINTMKKKNVPYLFYPDPNLPNIRTLSKRDFLQHWKYINISDVQTLSLNMQERASSDNIQKQLNSNLNNT